MNMRKYNIYTLYRLDELQDRLKCVERACAFDRSYARAPQYCERNVKDHKKPITYSFYTLFNAKEHSKLSRAVLQPTQRRVASPIQPVNGFVSVCVVFVGERNNHHYHLPNRICQYLLDSDTNLGQSNSPNFFSATQTLAYSCHTATRI